MTEFHNEIRRRTSQARESLAQARATGDEYLAGIHAVELQDLARIAAEHGIALDGIEEAAAPYGPA